MTVLSLFDGISCGRLALQRAGITVDTYYASEIAPSAIKIATANHKDIIEIGDVCKVSYDVSTGTLHTEKGDYVVGSIDLLLGGSPCTDFSSIGYARGMTVNKTEIKTLTQYLRLKKRNIAFTGQSYLFWEYVRILNEVKPKYFLLENVVMASKWRGVIDKALGVEPIAINSSLLSAQNRARLYWTNIPDVTVPEDKGVTLDDIFASDAPIDDVSHCVIVQKNLPRLIQKYGYLPERFNAYNAVKLSDKGCALSRGSMITSSCAVLLWVACPTGVHKVEQGIMDGKYATHLSDGTYNLRRLSLKEQERLQTLPDDYTAVEGVSSQKRSEGIGNGWTVDVIAHILSFI